MAVLRGRHAQLLHLVMLLRFIPLAEHDELEYARRIREAWATDLTLINVEHDNEFSKQLVDQLLACPESLCTHAYRMHLPSEYYAHGWARIGSQGVVDRWVLQGDEWCDWSGIGFCKITPQARLGDIPIVHWSSVETAVNQHITGRWHIHWPEIEHDHYEAR